MMNTIWADTAGVHDDLRSPADLDAWLDAVGIDARIDARIDAGVDRPGARATADELVSARALRDAARRLAAYVTDDSRPAATSGIVSLPDAIVTVNAAAREVPARQLELHAGRLELTSRALASPVTAAIAQVAEGVIELVTGADADRLRACNAPGCVLYFSKTHPRREWCSVACGNRARAARHYAKIRSAHPLQAGHAGSPGSFDGSLAPSGPSRPPKPTLVPG
jgi:predicted RNA-binding Zn ribbon-like protein